MLDMIVSVLKENLGRATADVLLAIPSKSFKAIDTCLLLRAEDGCFTVSAACDGLRVQSLCPARIDVNGAIAVQAKLLNEIIIGLPPERIDLAVNYATQSLSIMCGSTRFNLKGFDQSMVKQNPFVVRDQYITVESGTLRMAVKEVSPFAAREDNRPILMACNIEVHEQELVLTTADGYRLARKVIPAETLEVPIVTNFNVSMSILNQFVKRLPPDSTKIEINIEEGSSECSFSDGRLQVVIPLIAGTYPDIKPIIPKEPQVFVSVFSAELASACKRCAVFAEGAVLPIKLTPYTGASIELNAARYPDGALQLITENQNTGDGADCVLAEVTAYAPVFDVKMNVNYLMDVLDAMYMVGKVVIELTARDRPVLVRPDSRSDLFYVIMPVADRV